MRKLVKCIWMMVLVFAMFAVGIVLADKYALRTQMIRLRVVAATDDIVDQQLKLEVKDAINAYLMEHMPDNGDVNQAEAYLRGNMDELTIVAKQRLADLGCEYPVSVYLVREAADTRHYDTFSLPAGVYNTLRVDIGGASGENWWCVIFPSLCMPKTAEAFSQTAVSCGVDENLADTLAGEEGYEIRFFFLDCLGKLENLFHKS